MFPKWYIFVLISCRVVRRPPLFDKSIKKWAVRFSVVLADILPFTLRLVTRDALVLYTTFLSVHFPWSSSASNVFLLLLGHCGRSRGCEQVS